MVDVDRAHSRVAGVGYQRSAVVDRHRLVRYAAVSGDLNPIHWHERTARSVGLDDVIAHGMLTMGLASGVIVDALEDPGAISQISVRFARPVVVPDDDAGVRVDLGAEIESETGRVILTATVDGEPVVKDGTATLAATWALRRTTD